MNTHIDFGFSEYQKYNPSPKQSSEIARIISEDRTQYKAANSQAEFTAKILGKFRKNALNRDAFPKVGDWVLLEGITQQNTAVISEILPRFSILARKANIEKRGNQIIAANINYCCVVFALEEKINWTWLDRFLLLASLSPSVNGENASCAIQPIMIFNKADQFKYSEAVKRDFQNRHKQIPVFITSATTGLSIEQLDRSFEKNSSVVFIGPSGSGKSSLINSLLNSKTQKTGDVRQADGKGRHTTTRRQLLSTGKYYIIDTPGIRELENLSDGESVLAIYADFANLATKCRYRNCDHKISKGCQILASVENGEIDKKRYRDFIKQSEFANAKGDYLTTAKKQIKKIARTRPKFYF